MLDLFFYPPASLNTELQAARKQDKPHLMPQNIFSVPDTAKKENLLSEPIRGGMKVPDAEP